MEIIGGKHFKTPDGEFVEMKSGTQYKIHVKNSHTYGKRQTCQIIILFVNCIYNVSVVHNSNTDPKINGISNPDGLTW